MAAWSSLSQTDKDKVANVLAAAREWAGMMARLNNLGRAIAAEYSGNVETVLAGLDAGVIPLNNASVGEEQLTKADLMNLVGYAMTCSDPTDGATGSYNSNYHRALEVRAAGIYNTLQQGTRGF